MSKSDAGAAIGGVGMAADSRCRGASTARRAARPGTVDRDDGAAAGLSSAERAPTTGAVEDDTTDAIGGEPDTSGATPIGSPWTSIRRCTVDGAPPAGAGVVGNGVTA